MSLCFFDECKQIFTELFEKQFSDVEQGSPLYSIYLDLLSKLSSGSVFLKPGKLEYYSISDADLILDKIDEREQFIEDMCSAKSAIEFIGYNRRSYKIMKPEDIHMRRIPIFQKESKIY